MSFNFGTPPKTTGGLTFGTPTTATNTTPGFTFGVGGGDAASKPGFSFGASPAPAVAATAASTFGTPVASGALNFASGATPTATASTPGFGLSPASTGFGAKIASPAQPAGGFSFSAAKPAASTGFSLTGTASAPITLGVTPPVSSAPLKLSLGSTGTPGLTTGLGQKSTTPASGLTTGFSTAAPTSTAAPALLSTSVAPSTGFSLGTPAVSQAVAKTSASVPSSGFTLGATSAVGLSLATPTSLTTSTPASLATTTTQSNAAALPGTSMNCMQLEDNINKWTLELEEQEKVFMNQATQVNAWDKMLIENGDKIFKLNDSVERIKHEQKALEHELEFIVSQQVELEDLIAPLERELGESSIRDIERELSYQLAENLDTQLKQMAEDLKEVIEHLNETNKTQDSNDPIVQISRILNAHMSSLQWVDSSTAQITSKLQQAQKIQETLRHNTERAFHRTFE